MPDVQTKIERVGMCQALGKRSLGQVSCTCKAFAPGRRSDGWLLCAVPECGHTQGVHQKVEVAA